MKLLKLLFMGILIITTVFHTTFSSKLNKGKDSKILRIVSTHHNNNYLTPRDENVYSDENETSKLKSSTTGKKLHLNNKQLLSKLGLTKIRIPASHSRKRLAVESRHHSRPDDSHMFIIKLPPNPYYYTNQIPIDAKTSIDDYGKNKVSLGFRSNGKPGKIYHWNIPALKKIVTGDSRGPIIRHKSDVTKLIDIKNIPTWSKPWENETIEKSYRKGMTAEQKSLKKKSPSYYAPIKHISKIYHNNHKNNHNNNNDMTNNNNNNKNNFHNKYFPGNGKPKGFYVIEKSHKPAYYKELIP